MLPLRPICLLALFAIVQVVAVEVYSQEPAGTAAGIIADSVDKDYANELPRFPPLSPEEAMQRFDVASGFSVELVAAEPLVMDPIAFAFDSRNRLFVVEMRDYSEQEDEHLGQIALLTDTDRDGRFDTRSTFVKNLSWPTGIWTWKDGVIVAHAPFVSWFRDTNDDGVSDANSILFEGFGRGNVQGLVNSLRWGIDGHIHGATSSSGAKAEQKLSPAAPNVSLNRRDFSIDPLSMTLAPRSGGGQHGLSFNRWGEKFVTSNSDHLQQVLDMEQWLSRHSSSTTLPSLRRSIAEDGPQAEVYRASPVEPWRIVRTRLRVSGVVKGIVEGGGRAAGYFTGATGTCILPDGLGFGVPGHDTAIVCDVGSNLVHRKKMIDHGLYWSAQRIDRNSELLRSKDTWFRPVQIGDGPDGALYIADMYREVIEHPKSLPPMIKKHLDLTSGRDRGRIYRIRPTETKPQIIPVLADFTSPQLVAQLSNPTSWQRMMASQLLIEREAMGIGTSLETLALSGTSPEARIHALHVLHRLQLFSQPLASKLLSRHDNTHPRVSEQCLHLLGETIAQTKKPLTQACLDEITLLASSTHPRLQLEIAKLSPDLMAEQKDLLLETLLPNVTQPTVQAVVATAGGDQLWKLFASEHITGTTLKRWLTFLMPEWIGPANPNTKRTRWVLSQLSHTDKQIRRVWLEAVADLPQSVSLPLASKLESFVVGDIEDAIHDALQRNLEPENQTMNPLRLLRLLPEDRQLHWATLLLTPETPQNATEHIIELVSWSGNTKLPALLIENLSSLTPSLQEASIRAISKRSKSVEQLATAIESDKLKASIIPLQLRESLMGAASPAVAEKLQLQLNQVSADRIAVVNHYASELKNAFDTSLSQQDLDSGREVFRKTCSQCHKLGGIGQDVGPPLRQLTDKSPQQLVETILDPNKEIDPKFAGYRVLLTDGRAISGIIRDESAGQFTLVEAGGKVHSIPREQVDQMISTGVSLMPNGFEQQITPDQLAQLIHFLHQPQ